MYNNYNGMPGRPMPNRPMPGRARPNQPGPNDDRFLGGFLGPFILGGLTGGVVAPYFWNRPPYPYPPYQPYPNNYYYYGGYYR